MNSTRCLTRTYRMEKFVKTDTMKKNNFSERSRVITTFLKEVESTNANEDEEILLVNANEIWQEQVPPTNMMRNLKLYIYTSSTLQVFDLVNNFNFSRNSMLGNLNKFIDSIISFHLVCFPIEFIKL